MHLWQSEDGLMRLSFVRSTKDQIPTTHNVSNKVPSLKPTFLHLSGGPKRKPIEPQPQCFVSQGAPLVELYPRYVQVSIDEVTLNQLWKRRFEFPKIREKLQIDACILSDCIYIWLQYQFNKFLHPNAWTSPMTLPVPPPLSFPCTSRCSWGVLRWRCSSNLLWKWKLRMHTLVHGSHAYV